MFDSLKILLVGCIIAICTLLVLGFISVTNQQANCNELNKLKHAFVMRSQSQANRTKKALPDIQYYKDHPDELRKAIDLIDRQLTEDKETFKDTECKGIFG